MPWEITIVNEVADRPLGDRQTVCGWLAEALPGVALRPPPLPPSQALEAMSAAVREAFLRPRLEAVYEADDFSLEFFCGDEAEIGFLQADVRGSGNPLPLLRRLCGARGWAVISAADRSTVDLSAEVPAQWQRFCDWRDQVIGKISDDKEGQA